MTLAIFDLDHTLINGDSDYLWGEYMVANGIVDEQALAEALRRGKLGGAGVDTLAKEPPDGSNPLLQPDIPNLILTPHSAWASRESRQRLLDGVAANIRAFQGGELRNRVA